MLSHPPPAFVLSMDPRRLRVTLEALRRSGVEAEHFPAVDGRDAALRARPEVSPFARHFCPDKTLGIALSHRAVASRFLRLPGRPPWCLTLEDDAVPLADADDDLPAALLQCARAHAGLDYVRLHCQGPCFRGSPFEGSMAAYLLSRRGAKKLLGLPVFWHADLELNRPHFSGGLRRLFTTRDARPDGALLLGDQRAGFWAAQPFLRLPGAGGGGGGVTLSFGAFFCASLALALAFAASGVPSAHALCCSLGLVLALLLLPLLRGSAEAAAIVLVLAASAVAAPPLVWPALWLATLAACARGQLPPESVAEQ
jgi:hypothetical protein